jgi:glycine cleavage system regulatory protein
MKFVITLLGSDRLGIVESFSKTVADHDGAWCESRIMQVEGQFGGVFLAEVPHGNADAFETSLESSFQPEFHLAVVRSNTDKEPASARLRLKSRSCAATAPDWFTSSPSSARPGKSTSWSCRQTSAQPR